MSVRHRRYSEVITDQGQYIDDEAFSRLDETDDTIFYSMDRFVSHLDSSALNTAEKLERN